MCVHRSGVYAWGPGQGQAFLVADWCAPSYLTSPASGFQPPSLCHRILLVIPREAGHRNQALPSALEPGCGPQALPGLCEARRGLGGAPGSRGRRCWHSRQPLCAQRACRPPAQRTDQAACERRDSCSCLKYAGYFYLPTSGSEGHPTSGLGCYTMFPFSREGKWREARLPDHMVLKSMKKKN